MSVHRDSESNRLLRQEASCLMDETSAAAQEKETNSLTSSGLQNLTYSLGPRNDGTIISFWLNVEGVQYKYSKVIGFRSEKEHIIFLKPTLMFRLLNSWGAFEVWISNSIWEGSIAFP